jgi:hypothetical protein
MPNKTYAIKDGVCKFGKQSKERITLLVGANMNGSEKWPLLVIGNSEHPRCHKELTHLPIKYYSNASAWMTCEIFLDYFGKINSKLMLNNRKIVLFIDNCACHPPYLLFSNIKIVFLPPNTTSVLQPMDAGVIKVFKVYYRLYAARKIISIIENGYQIHATTITLLMAISMACNACSDLSTATISNCFRHCGFYRAKCRTESVGIEFNLIEKNFEELQK